jgi:N-methylhydantoinase B
MARAAIRELPDGAFSFEDWIDDDGIERDRPIRLYCTISKQGDGLLVDWNGTSPQVKGAINCTLSFTKAVSYAAIRSVLGNDIPCNEGLFRTIEVIAPEGSINNMLPPAACAARGLTGFRMGDCLFGALAMMLPDRVFAASDGGNTCVSIGGYTAERKPFIFVDFTCGSWGGRPWADGVQGNSNMFANMACQSVEVIEAENPLQVRAFEFITDRAGAGKYRGGVPYRRDYRMLEEEAVLQVRSDRRRVRPYGLYGGHAGKPSNNVLNPNRNSCVLDSKLIMTMYRDDVFRHEWPGGGGWGDPLTRDPLAVLDDVRNEFVSEQAARDEYGVVVDTTVWQVDVAATERWRTKMHEARGDIAPDDVKWE